MFKFCLMIFLMPVIIYIYKRQAQSVASKSTYDLEFLNGQVEQVFGKNKTLPEGCTLAPFKSTLGLLKFQLGVSDSDSQSGFYEGKPELPFVGGVCQIKDKILRTIIPVVWVGVQTKPLFPTNVVLEKFPDEYSNGFITVTPTTMALKGAYLVKPQAEEKLQIQFHGVREDNTGGRPIIVQKDLAGQTLMQQIILGLPAEGLFKALFMHFHLYILFIQIAALYYGSEESTYDNFLAMIAGGLRVIADFTWSGFGLNSMPEMWFFFFEVNNWKKRDYLDQALIFLFMGSDVLTYSKFQWWPSARLFVLFTCIAYFVFITIEHYVRENPRRVCHYIVIKNFSMIAFCYNDVYLILNACSSCNPCLKALAALRLFFEPLRLVMGADLEQKWQLIHGIFGLDPVQDYMTQEVVVTLIWIVYVFRKVAFYVMINNFNFKKSNAFFSELNWVVFFYFWWNIERGLWTVIKIDFAAWYLRHALSGIVNTIKEEAEDNCGDFKESHGLDKHLKTAGDKATEQRKKIMKRD